MNVKHETDSKQVTTKYPVTKDESIKFEETCDSNTSIEVDQEKTLSEPLEKLENFPAPTIDNNECNGVNIKLEPLVTEVDIKEEDACSSTSSDELSDSCACQSCGSNARKTAGLTKYMMHSSMQSLRCELCSCKSFDKSSFNNSQVQMYVGEKPFKCSICRYKTVDEPYLCKNHYGDNYSVCKTYNLQSTYKLEHRMHDTGEKPFQCTHRNDYDEHSSETNNHIYIRDNPCMCKTIDEYSLKLNEATVSCTDVQETYDDSHDQKSLLQQYIEKKLFECKICSYKTISKAKLERHKFLLHMDEKIPPLPDVSSRKKRFADLNLPKKDEDQPAQLHTMGLISSNKKLSMKVALMLRNKILSRRLKQGTL